MAVRAGSLKISDERNVMDLDKNKKSPLAAIWQLGKPGHKRIKISVLLAVIGVVSGMMVYYFAARVVLGLLANNRDFSLYIIYLVGALAAYLVKTSLYALALAISHRAAFGILKEIRTRALEKLPKMPIGDIAQINSGKLKQIIVDQVEKLEITLAHVFPEMTGNLAGPLVMFGYLLFTDWRMALVSLISLPIGMAFMMTVMKGYAANYAVATKNQQNMNNAINEYIGGIEVIKAYNQGENSYKRLADSVLTNADYYFNWMKKSNLGIAMAMGVAPATMITVLPIGFLFYSSGQISGENFIITIILSFGLIAPLIAAMQFVDELAVLGSTVDSVNEILDAPEQNHPAQGRPLDSGDIKLENVSFSYKEGTEVLKNIDLTIEKGSVTALVGPSGSGKSTISKLVAAFWDANQGRITIGGQDLKDTPLDAIYQHISYVSQDNFLFDDTVINNIRMGRPSATDAEVIEISKKSACHEFIMRLSEGYQTRVGFGGAHLSGGEKQRITIARAMLKDAPVIIMDEAAAYIDPENESVMQSAIAKMVGGKTLIIIAHRLSTITEADKIVLVNNGQIAAQGRHQDLLEDSTLYRDMWNAHIGTKTFIGEA